MKQRIATALEQLERLQPQIRVDGATDAAALKTTLEQALGEADAPPVPTTLEAIAADVRALREAAGV